MKRLPTLRFARLVTAGALTAVLLGGGSRLEATEFIRGDVNGDGTVTLSDIQPLLSWLFRMDVQPQCLNAADVQPSGNVDLKDAIDIVTFLLFGSPAPGAPFPAAGPDSGTTEDLGCNAYGGAPLQDPAAEIRVLDSVAPGGTDGYAHLTIAVSNSDVIAGLSGDLLVDTSVAGGTGLPKALVEPAQLPYLSNSLANGRLKFIYVRSATEVVYFDPGEGVPVLEVKVCFKPGTKAGEYPLDLVSGELIDAASGRAIHPRLVSGTLRISSDLAEGAGCRCEDLPPPPPPPTIPPALNAKFEIGVASAAAGSTVAMPFSIRADAEVQGFSFSVDFDEEALEAQAVETVFQKPNGTDWGFKVFKFNNSNATPGNGGIDEGFLIGAGVFSMTDGCNNLPANRDNEVLRFQFLVKPEAAAGSTELRFLDGGSINSDRIHNVLTAYGRTWTPETASSFVFVDGRIGVLPEITTFVRGDSNGDEKVDVSDGQHTLGHLFLGGERPFCYDAADANDDGAINIADAVSTLTFLFLDSAVKIPPPYPQAGEDPTPDDLRCLSRS